MQLVIVHYHFDPGGVTQVVLNHLAALERHCDHVERVVVLSGPRHSAWPTDPSFDIPVEFVIVDSLEYGVGVGLADDLVEALATSNCPADSTLVHIHNHSLGKNAQMLTAIRRLAELGYRLLLQIHDFAEDCRPGNYQLLTDAEDDRLSQNLYPSANNIHYAVLNRRDYSILNGAGVSESQLHWLPNPVSLPFSLSDKRASRQLLHQRANLDLDSKFIVYPVRGIRRKNIGEALLWSLLVDDAIIGFTLPPANPVEQPSYFHWEALANELDLSVRFGLGTIDGIRFPDIVSAADLMISTSVAEGFGMVFLETWLFGRSLLGRDLPEITSDFKQAGMSFPGLSSRLLVPVEWIDVARYRSALSSLYRKVLLDYGREFAATEVDQVVKQRMSAEAIDFALLDVASQADVIRHARTDAVRVRDLNPVNASDVVEANREIVEREFSLEMFAGRLNGAYSEVMGSEASEVQAGVNVDSVLMSFLGIERFTPLRVS